MVRIMVTEFHSHNTWSLRKRKNLSIW